MCRASCEASGPLQSSFSNHPCRKARLHGAVRGHCEWIQSITHPASRPHGSVGATARGGNATCFARASGQRSQTQIMEVHACGTLVLHRHQHGDFSLCEQAQFHVVRFNAEPLHAPVNSLVAECMHTYEVAVQLERPTAGILISGVRQRTAHLYMHVQTLVGLGGRGVPARARERSERTWRAMSCTPPWMLNIAFINESHRPTQKDRYPLIRKVG